MTGNFLRRTILAVAVLGSVVLASCGGGTTESALVPSRFISIGDGMSDVGQKGSTARYTVNDGSVTTWVDVVVNNYAVTAPLTPSSSGGLGFAQGNARIYISPDAAGNTATLTITQQADALLAAGPIGSNDVILINGGVGDIVAEMSAVLSGAQTEAQMLANLKQIGGAYGKQVRRLVEAGAKHMVVVGAFDVGRSPWATTIGQVAALSAASVAFNTAFVVSIVDLGNQVLYVDMASFVNAYALFPTSYGFTDGSSAVCTSVDPGPGIGIGPNNVNASLCNATTVIDVATYNSYVFADALHFTPALQRAFGSNVYLRLAARW